MTGNIKNYVICKIIKSDVLVSKRKAVLINANFNISTEDTIGKITVRLCMFRRQPSSGRRYYHFVKF